MAKPDVLLVDDHGLRSHSSFTLSHTVNTDTALVSVKGGKPEGVAEDDWDRDPENARNWPSQRKWIAVGVVSLYCLNAPLPSAIMAPGLPEFAQRYHTDHNEVTTALMLSIYLLSFALGPPILAPLSEMYGRTWVLHICNALSGLFSLGCAFAPNVTVFIVLRFFSGFVGVAPIPIGSGSVGDCFAPRDRATAMAVYSLGPFIGPIIGPIAGGYIAQTVGVKYVFIVVASFAALSTIVGIVLLRETYAPVIRARCARRKGDIEGARLIEAQTMGKRQDKLGYLWENLSRPLILLTRSFICFILGLYIAFLYGIYFIMFATFPKLFNTVYGFKTGPGGFAYVGLGISFLFSSVFSVRVADRVYKYLADKNGGVGTPEMRMPTMMVGSICCPAGLLWYGWTAQAHMHWIMPIIGTGIFGFGAVSSFLPIQLYLVDAFHYGASAAAAVAILRHVFGFIFPLFGEPMFIKLGIGIGNSLLGVVAAVLGIPFPVWIYYKGGALRERSKLRL